MQQVLVQTVMYSWWLLNATPPFLRAWLSTSVSQVLILSGNLTPLQLSLSPKHACLLFTYTHLYFSLLPPLSLNQCPSPVFPVIPSSLPISYSLVSVCVAFIWRQVVAPGVYKIKHWEGTFLCTPRLAAVITSLCVGTYASYCLLRQRRFLHFFTQNILEHHLRLLLS